MTAGRGVTGLGGVDVVERVDSRRRRVVLRRRTLLKLILRGKGPIVYLEGMNALGSADQ